LRAVEVGGDRVQQPRALPQPAPERLPLLRLHDQREHIEAPRALQAIGGRVNAVGDAVLIDLTRDALLRLRETLRAQLSRRRKRRPRRAQRAVYGAHLVEMTVGDDVVRRQRQHGHGRIRRSNV
jgi:hypothetical protein